MEWGAGIWMLADHLCHPLVSKMGWFTDSGPGGTIERSQAWSLSLIRYLSCWQDSFTPIISFNPHNSKTFYGRERSRQNCEQNHLFRGPWPESALLFKPEDCQERHKVSARKTQRQVWQRGCWRDQRNFSKFFPYLLFWLNVTEHIEPGLHFTI
jgi:hypothetical protein